MVFITIVTGANLNQQTYLGDLTLYFGITVLAPGILAGTAGGSGRCAAHRQSAQGTDTERAETLGECDQRGQCGQSSWDFHGFYVFGWMVTDLRN